MLIGISGKLGSGKDTVGKIIQYLTHCKNDNTSYEEWCSLKNYNMCNWQIKKFANKLKDIVCLLIGCTREQLEDVDFKNKELGEEWNKYRVYNFKDKKPYIYFNTEAEVFEYLAQFNQKDRWKYEKTLIKLTPRLLLQLLGTECGRDIIHPNIWVNALMSEYKYLGDKTGEIITCNIKTDFPNWIITDMRFPNELKAVKDRRGITIRVNRLFVTEVIGENKVSWIPIPTVDYIPHESETALDNAEFDYTIINDSSIEDLIEKVKEILIKEKII